MATTTVTVNVAESQNYLATSRTISVNSDTKQQGYITLSTNSVTLTGDVGTTQTVTITSNSGGALSVASSDTSKVTASLSGTTITLTSVANGNATVMVTVGETSEYTSATATISVNVSIVVKTKVAIPTQTTALVYNTSSQYIYDAVTYDRNKVFIVGGATSHSDAGTYQETFRLYDTTLYEWSDGTTSDKVVSWTISKANLNSTLFIYDEHKGMDVTRLNINGSVGNANMYLSSTNSTYTYDDTMLVDFYFEPSEYPTPVFSASGTGAQYIQFRYDGSNKYVYDTSLPYDMYSVPVTISVTVPESKNYAAMSISVNVEIVSY